MEKLYNAVKGYFSYLISNCKTDKKKLGVSTISLFLTLVVLVTASICWYSLSNIGTLDSGEMNVNGGNGLVIDGGSGKATLKIDNGVKLTPASSVNGYNLFFPLDGNFTTDVNSMKFRRATVGDKNVNFIQMDFTLASEVEKADVYLDSTSSVKINGRVNSAIRVAFISDVVSSPVVFNPSSSSTKTDVVTDVSLLDGKCVGTTKNVSSYPMNSHRKICTVKKDEPTKVSVVMWLEGTDSSSGVSSIPGGSLAVNLTLTTIE